MFVYHFSFLEQLLKGTLRPCAINCSFMVIYERKYEHGMRSLFEYFSKIQKFLILLKKKLYKEINSKD